MGVVIVRLGITVIGILVYLHAWFEIWSKSFSRGIWLGMGCFDRTQHAWFFVLFSVYYTFIRYKRPVLQCEGYRQYVSMLLYGCLDRKKAKQHVEWKNFWAIIGNMFAIGYIIIRVLVILNNVGVWTSIQYAIGLPLSFNQLCLHIW